MEQISIRKLISADLPNAIRLLDILNEDTPLEVIKARLNAILTNHLHYQLFGAFIKDRLVGIAGAWLATKIWSGRYLEIDNLIVDPEERSAGIGSLLIEYLEKIAEQQDCNLIVLDSYTTNRPSHRLYHRLGFEIWGFHFVKSIGPSKR